MKCLKHANEGAGAWPRMMQVYEVFECKEVGGVVMK